MPRIPHIICAFGIAAACACWTARQACAAEAWYATPGEDKWVSFGLAENRATEYGLPLFVCRAGGIAVDAFTAEPHRSREWKPPSEGATIEIGGSGIAGGFSSGAIPVVFHYDRHRGLWILTGRIELTNPVWNALQGAEAVEMTVQGTKFPLVTGQLWPELSRFMTRCKELMSIK